MSIRSFCATHRVLVRPLASCLGLFLGCGYHSSYVPPDDYAFRAIWHGNRLALIGPTFIDRCDRVRSIDTPMQMGRVAAPIGIEQVALPESETYQALAALARVTDAPVVDVALDVVGTQIEEDDSPGAAAAIAVAAVATVALAIGAVALAFPSATRAEANAATLHKLAVRNAELRSAMRTCRTEGSGS